MNGWSVEVLSVMPDDDQKWTVVYAGDESGARKKFTDIEMECASNQRGHTQIRLFEGKSLRLHIWWNRGMPNKPDGMRDWSK